MIRAGTLLVRTNHMSSTQLQRRLWNAGKSKNIDDCYCHCSMALLGSSNFKAGVNMVLKRYVICICSLYTAWDWNGGHINHNKPYYLILWILSVFFGYCFLYKVPTTNCFSENPVGTWDKLYQIPKESAIAFLSPTGSIQHSTICSGQ